MTPDEPSTEAMTAQTAGRFAAVLLVVGGVVGATNPLSYNVTPGGRVATFVVCAVAILGGPIVAVVPWRRFRRSATLVVVPPALAVIAVGNHVNPDPYVSGMFFVVVAVWVGLCHRRGTMALLAPAFWVTYWLPLHLRPHLPTLDMSSVVVVLVSVTVGEALAWSTSRMEAARRRIREVRQRRLDTLVKRSADVTLVVGTGGQVLEASPSSSGVLGVAPEQLVGRAIGSLWAGPADGDPIAGPVLEAMASPGFERVSELQLAHADGRLIDVEVLVRNLVDDPDVRALVVNLRDITDRKRLERDLGRQAFYDGLTGLPNRALFRERLAHEVEARRSSAGVLYVDLDGFKAVNDSLGHAQGDELLRMVAQRLAAELAPADTLARLGGDEFAVLVDSCTTERLEDTAARMLRALEAPFALAGGTAAVSASIGLRMADADVGPDEVVRDADTAMYEAKTSGGGAALLFEPGMRAALMNRLAMERDLRRAVDEGQFVVHFQPTVDLATGEPVGAEALVRWLHPERGLIGPAEFIPIAEATRLIVPLGRWVLRAACIEAASWQRVDRAYSVAVNVSARQFQDAGLLDDVREALRASGLPPELLTIELTESVLVDATAARRLCGLKALGVHLALDDFGTGYSSLRYLKDLPFDVLKIDKSFVDGVLADGDDTAVIRSIMRLGAELGMHIVAEGIEDADQWTALRGMGGEIGQGYLFWRPMPADAVRGVLAGRPAAADPGPSLERSHPVGSGTPYMA